jgi:ComF family protein
MIEDLLALLFPEHCIGCNKAGSTLCAICERAVTSRPHALGSTTATLFDYKNPLVKKALWALKYHRKRSLGKYFGIALYREFFKPLAHGGKSTKDILLVPIPSGSRADALRGYNHAAIIATAIAASAKADGLTLHLETKMLVKKHGAKRQVEAQTKAKRIKNISDAFNVRHGERITGKTVILIDDIVTTGATLKEARHVLAAWKPKRILAVAVAH